jgi:DNA-binding IscR family transcriptional regulator
MSKKRHTSEQIIGKLREAALIKGAEGVQAGPQT